jgi:DNA repair photolyase
MGDIDFEADPDGTEQVRIIAGRIVGPILDGTLVRGRGARSNQTGRFEQERRESFDDGWSQEGEARPLRTEVRTEPARSIIATNDSPDISFDQSINPYRGCEHGCSYCYARPTHCFLGHSAGLDFETKLYAKANAAELLERELANPRYVPRTLALGTATDPYQPIERYYKITRSILEVLETARHPVGIVTKSALVTRDSDILSRMAKDKLVKVALSVTTLDRMLARKMEPRASTPARRLEAIRQLSAAGIPTQVMVAPVIPGLNDNEIERILAAARDAGAEQAGYVMLRLPLELKDLFREWLATDLPERANRVLKLLREIHGGRDYTAEFGLRQKGSGPYAQHIAQRFRMALNRLGLNERRHPLRTDLFVRPVAVGQQMSLFDGAASQPRNCG